MLKERSSLNVTTESRHWTALHLAVHRGESAIAEYLLELGANPNAVTLDGLTPMGKLINRRFW